MQPITYSGQDSAYRLLRDLIVRGRLPPGTGITEAEAATRLGTSRTPVREALHRLRHEGLVAVSHGGERPRLAVSPLSASAVEELYLATGALEGVAARAVADMPPPARKSLAQRMASLDAEFRDSAQEPVSSPEPAEEVLEGWDRMFERHDAFHRALQDACAGPNTRALLDTLRPQIDRYEWLFAQLTGPDFTPTYAEHAAIVRAVRGGTADDIEAAVRANWFGGAGRLASVISRASPARLRGGGWDAALAPATPTIVVALPPDVNGNPH